MEKLDQEILNWIASRSNEGILCQQLRKAKVERRDYIRTGYFVYFILPQGVPLLEGAVRPLCPDISSPLLKDSAGSSLFFKKGKVHYLEIYTRGGFFPENITNFHLVAPAS